MLIAVPYPNFIRSARVLETQRIAKMLDWIDELLDPRASDKIKKSSSYSAWRDAPNALADYGNALSKELISRGLKQGGYTPFPYNLTRLPYSLPYWFGNPDLHKWHRSYLFTNNPDHFRKFWPEPPEFVTCLAWPKYKGE